MKKLFAITVALMSLMSVIACNKAIDDNNGNPGDILNNSSWSKAVEAHPFLSNFPEFAYDFNGTYTETPGGESYVIAAWNMEKDVADEYKNKLKASGFSGDSDNAIFKKSSDDKIYTCGVSYGGKMIGITYSVSDSR